MTSNMAFGRREARIERAHRSAAVLVRALAVVVAACAVRAATAAPPANAELDAHAMMEKNFFVSKIKSLKSEATMVLINDKGQTRERKNTTVQVLQPNGVDSKLLVKFSTPADIKGTAFLQVEHSDAEDDQWLYLPALGKSRRLVANNKKDSFVGSDFSYGDISLPKVDLYQHRLLRSEPVDGYDCYIVESIPKNETIKADFASDLSFESRVDATLDALADHLERHIAVDRIWEIANGR